MHTEIIKITEQNREGVVGKAGKIIKNGGLVVFPTETVYGLGANVFNEDALAKIFTAKGRPSDNPLIVHVCNQNQLIQLTDYVSPLEQKLIDKFWPGPLTIIFSKKKEISKLVSGGLDTIAVRMPSFPVARELIEFSGVPIAAPSANTSGRPSSTTGAIAFNDLMGKVDMIIEAGESEIGVESTVIRVGMESVSILRPGAVTKEMLEEIVKPLPVVLASGRHDLEASPGTRYKHYAPKATLEIVKKENLEKRRDELLRAGEKVEIILEKEKSLGEVSQNLYSALRYFDTHQVDVILVPEFPREGLGVAIMDRLSRAAGKEG